MPKTQAKQLQPNYTYDPTIVQVNSDLELPGIKSFFPQSIFWLRRVVGIVFPRASFIKKPGKKEKSFPTLADMAAAFGFSVDECEVALETHEKRLSKRTALVLLIVVPIAVLLFFAPFWYILNKVGFNFWYMLDLYLLLFPLTFVLMKIVLIVIDRFYADSLCLQACFGALVELTDPKVLENPDHKRYLLLYIGTLARQILLLPLCFQSSSAKERAFARDYFRKMENYVRERERAAILPAKDTLACLRRDFMGLTWMFITGNYSYFELPEEVGRAAPEPETERHWYQSLSSWVVKLAGTLVPLAILYLIVYRPGAFEGLPLDTNVLTLITLAWLLLSIDSLFSLGVTSKIASLAKEIKELT